MANLRDDLKPYSSLITNSFRDLIPVQECAERLRLLGFPVDDSALETIKDISLEAAWIGNEHIKEFDFTLEFIIINVGKRDPGAKTFVLLIEAIDSLLDDNKHNKKITPETIAAVVAELHSQWPAFLTWLPAKHLHYIKNVLRVSIDGAP